MDPVFLNGILLINNRVAGSRAEFNCSEGFTLIGQSSYVCDINGNWIGNGGCGKNLITFKFNGNYFKYYPYSCQVVVIKVWGVVIVRHTVILIVRI